MIVKLLRRAWVPAVCVVVMLVGAACAPSAAGGAGAGSAATGTTAAFPAPTQLSPGVSVPLPPAGPTQAVASNPAPALDACSIVTQSEAQAVLGGEFTTNLSEYGDGTRCTYTRVGATVPYASVIFWAVRGPAEYQQQLSSLKARAIDSSSLPGLGEQATIFRLSGGSGLATVARGAYLYVEIDPPGQFSRPTVEAEAQQLARIGMARIP
jgi:hypothetical protein